VGNPGKDAWYATPGGPFLVAEVVVRPALLPRSGTVLDGTVGPLAGCGTAVGRMQARGTLLAQSEAENDESR